MRKILLLLLALPTLLFAQGRKTVTPPLIPYVSETGANFQFRSFEDDQGGFYLVWPHADLDGSVLLAQHVDSSGTPRWTEPGVPLVKGLTPSAAWEAGADSKGGIVLVLETDKGIRSQRFDAQAKPLWPAQNEAVGVSSFTQKWPVLAADGAGGAYVVWQEKRFPTRWVLMAQHVTAQGAPLWSAEGTRVSLSPTNQQRPNVVYDGVVGLVVAWQDSRESASQVQAQRMNYQGIRLWGPQGVFVTAPAGDPEKVPYLAAVGGGSAVLAWRSSSSAADRIFLQRVDSTGQMKWGQGVEVSIGNWNEWNPVIHGDGQGGTWVGWEDFRNQNNWKVYVQHIQADGKPVWTTGEVPLSTFQSSQGQLAMVDDGQKGILAAFIDNRFGATGVYLQQINQNGQVLQDAEGLKAADRMTNPKIPQILHLAPGQAVISWVDSPSKGHWSLYWKRLDLKS